MGRGIKGVTVMITIPKAVVFDLGKVLLEFDYSIAVNNLLARCQVSSSELRQLINQSPLLLRYETGSLTSEQFFQEVQTAAGFCGSLDEFSAIFGAIFHPIQPMID